MNAKALVVLLSLAACASALAQEAPPPGPAPEPAPGSEAPPPADTPETAAPVPAPTAPPADAPTAPAQVSPPTTTAPAAAPERGVTLQEQQEKKRKRHSRFAAGPGGALFVFTEVISGLVTGGLVGATYDQDDDAEGSDGAYLGALTGGVLLGSAAMVYQYYEPIGNGTSAMLALGAGVGFLGGLGIVDLMDDTVDDDRRAAWLLLATTQVGILTTLLATMGLEDDVSGSDAALVGMTTTYATTITGLILWIIESNNRNTSAAPVLLAPAGGMALGALLATQIELPPGRALKLTAIPLGVGLTLLYLGGLADDDTIPPASALVGTVAAFALTALFTAEPPPDELARAPSSSFPAQVSLVPVLAPAGRRGEGMAAGPGLFATW